MKLIKGIYPKGNNYSEKLYYDGVPFTVSVDNQYKVNLKSTYDSQKVNLTYYGDGVADLVYEENGKSTTYDLRINELTSDSMNIEIYEADKLV